jgi:hypothetical protein
MASSDDRTRGSIPSSGSDYCTLSLRVLILLRRLWILQAASPPVDLPAAFASDARGAIAVVMERAIASDITFAECFIWPPSDLLCSGPQIWTQRPLI